MRKADLLTELLYRFDIFFGVFVCRGYDKVCFRDVNARGVLHAVDLASCHRVRRDKFDVGTEDALYFVDY